MRGAAQQHASNPARQIHIDIGSCLDTSASFNSANQSGRFDRRFTKTKFSPCLRVGTGSSANARDLTAWRAECHRCTDLQTLWISPAADHDNVAPAVGSDDALRHAIKWSRASSRLRSARAGLHEESPAVARRDAAGAGDIRPAIKLPFGQSQWSKPRPQGARRTAEAHHVANRGVDLRLLCGVQRGIGHAEVEHRALVLIPARSVRQRVRDPVALGLAASAAAGRAAEALATLRVAKAEVVAQFVQIHATEM